MNDKEIVSQNNMATKEQVYTMFLLIFLALIVVIMVSINGTPSEQRDNYIKEMIVKNSKTFKKGSSLICPSSTFANQENYLVSKKNGWKIYRRSYFQKNDLLLNIEICKWR